MSLGLEKKRQDSGGYPADGYPPPGVVVDRIHSLLRTWQLFGTGGEDNMIAELHQALGRDKPSV